NDGQGFRSEDGQTEVEDTRLLVDDATDTTIVTWERQSNYQMGDSFRSPMAAVRVKGGPFRVVEFPVEAYACATYGQISAHSSEHPLVTWGVSNTRGFELWKDVPQTSKDELGRRIPKTGSERTVFTKKQEIGAFAVSHDVVLAATLDGACDALC